MAYRTIKAMVTGPQKEAKATAASTVYPGDLVQLHTDSTVKEHATDSGPAQAMFAIEDSLQGKEIGTVYTAGTQVRYIVGRKGDEVIANLADNQTAVVGSYLISAGNGRLKVYSAASAGVSEWPNSIVAQAMEALDTNNSAATPLASSRIRVEII